jgi:hypothetical protein
VAKDIRTNLIVSAEAKGFDPTRQQMGKLSEEAVKGLAGQAKGFDEARNSSLTYGKALERINKLDFREVQKQIGGLEKNLSELAKQQMAVTEAMSSIDDKASPAYKNLEDNLKSIQDESKSTEREIKSLTNAFKEQAKEAEKASKAKGAFIQGLAQGGLPFPAPFLQRGPGMGRQVAGMAVGKALTGGARGAGAMGGAMFGGVQGMAQAIGAIPIVGGPLAGQFQAAAQYAQQNIQWQRTKLEAAPYIESFGGMMERRRSMAARSSPYRKALQEKENIWARYEQKQEMANEYRIAIREKQDKARMEATLEEARKKGIVSYGAEYVSQKAGGVEAGIADFANKVGEGIKSLWTGKGTVGTLALEERERGIEKAKLLRGGTLEGSELSIKELYKKLKNQEKVIADYKDDVLEADKKYRRVEKETEKKYGTGPFRDIGRMGLQLMGVAKPEATQAARAMLATGGGYADQVADQGIIGAGFAAKTRFQIGLETSGAFLGAGRRGGAVGARGQGGVAFKEAIAEGLQLGLTGSELNRWMQETAQGIQQFQATGIEINTRSVSALAKDISGAGITGTRATTMARGITGGLQQIGQRGIQSGLDLYMLQTLGGYQGGGSTQYRASLMEIEKLAGTIKKEGVGGITGHSKISDAFKGIMQMAGGDTGGQEGMLQSALRSIGVTVSATETNWLARSLRGEEATPEQLAAISSERTRQSEGRAELTAIEEAGGLEAAARKTVGTYAPGAKAQAALENQQIAVGGKMVGVVLKLEKMALRANTAFTTLAGPTMESVTSSLDQLASKAAAAAESFAKSGGLLY